MSELLWPMNLTGVVSLLTARTLVTFHVVNVVDNKRQIRPGVDVVSTLSKKLRSSTDAFDFRVVELDTVGEFSSFFQFIYFVFALYVGFITVYSIVV